MKVQAVRVKNGFLIPFIDELKNVRQDKIMIEIKVIEHEKDEVDEYFDQYHFDLSGFKFDREEANAH